MNTSVWLIISEIVKPDPSDIHRQTSSELWCDTCGAGRDVATTRDIKHFVVLGDKDDPEVVVCNRCWAEAKERDNLWGDAMGTAMDKAAEKEANAIENVQDQLTIIGSGGRCERVPSRMQLKADLSRAYLQFGERIPEQRFDEYCNYSKESYIDEFGSLKAAFAVIGA